MSTFRKTGIVGEYQIDNILEVSSIHFSEWNNGEGLDFVLFDKDSNEKQKFSLTIEQLNAISVISEAIGFIDLDGVKSEAKEFRQASEKREREIERIRTKYQQDIPGSIPF